MTVSEFNSLVDDYGKEIYSFCKKLTYNEFDAEELYQDTFLKAMDNLEKIDINNNPKSFLLSISVSLWNNKKRKYARRNRIAPTEYIDEENKGNQYTTGQTPEKEYLKKELYDIINKTVAELDEKMRVPFILYYTMNISVEKIGEMLSCPEGTVKSRLHNARKQIRSKMEVYGIDRI